MTVYKTDQVSSFTCIGRTCAIYESCRKKRMSPDGDGHYDVRDVIRI
ncbi:hypothetical protein HUB94_29915 (plasmid) [Paenibacillus cellulosilyticus]|nr:hypothetical protein HUB94_29915 [Paenibacillus cellulosilyticus]